MLERWSNFLERCAEADSLPGFLRRISEGRKVWFYEVPDKVYQEESQRRKRPKPEQRKPHPFDAVSDEWTGERIFIEDSRHPNHSEWDTHYAPY